MCDYEVPNLLKQDLEKLRTVTVPIPSNENSRLLILRETNLLDSEIIDPTYDRFTSFCQRIFKVGSAMISLIDVDRQWIKSITGPLKPNDDHRNNSFCCYTILPESPEVLVVRDTLADDRFSKNINSTNHPYIRFYAGAALIVDGVRIGALCLMDKKPRYDFSQEEKMNLLDLGNAVSSLIAMRRESFQKLETKRFEYLQREQTRLSYNLALEKNNLMRDMMHQVRTPLMSILLSASMVESGHRRISRRLQSDDELLELSHNVDTSLADLKLAVSQLERFVKSTVKVDDILAKDDIHKLDITELTDDDYENELIIPQQRIMPVPCNFVELLDVVQEALSSASKSMVVDWIVDNRLKEGMINTHPDILKFSICSIIGRAISFWHHATISISFNIYGGLSNNNNSVSGYISLLIRLVEPISRTVHKVNAKSWGNNSSRSNNNSSRNNSGRSIGSSNSCYKTIHLIDIKSIERLLVDIGGDCRIVNFDSNLGGSNASFTQPSSQGNQAAGYASPDVTEQLFEIFIPCDIDTTHNRGGDGSTSSNYHNSLLVVNTNNSDDNNNNTPTSPCRHLAEYSHMIQIQKQLSNVTIQTTAQSSLQSVAGTSSNDPCSASASAYTILLPPLLRSYSQDLEPLLTAVQIPPPLQVIKELAEVSDHCFQKGEITPPPPLSTSNNKTIRVLVVDDSEIIFKVMKKWLEVRGCIVSCAINGKIGLGMMTTNQYDIVLMDFIMPVMLGRDAMKWFQEWRQQQLSSSSAAPTTTTTPITNKEMLLIGMSANANDRDVAEAFTYGMHFFAEKPVNMSFLTAALAAKGKYTSLQSVIDEIVITTGYPSPAMTQKGCSANHLEESKEEDVVEVIVEEEEEEKEEEELKVLSLVVGDVEENMKTQIVTKQKIQCQTRSPEKVTRQTKSDNNISESSYIDNPLPLRPSEHPAAPRSQHQCEESKEENNIYDNNLPITISTTTTNNMIFINILRRLDIRRCLQNINMSKHPKLNNRIKPSSRLSIHLNKGSIVT